MNNKKSGKARARRLPCTAILAESAMFGDPFLHRRQLLVAVLLLGCAATASNGKNLCDVAPDEATMLQVVKPVAKAIFKCVDDVILPYKVRGEVASAILQLTCEEYLNCAGKNMGKKAPPDLPTGDQHQPRELVAPMLECFMTRLDLPMENERKKATPSCIGFSRSFGHEIFNLSGRSFCIKSVNSFVYISKRVRSVGFVAEGPFLSGGLNKPSVSPGGKARAGAPNRILRRCRARSSYAIVAAAVARLVTPDRPSWTPSTFYGSHGPGYVEIARNGASRDPVPG
ncbi:hypothetical protein MRX96_026009 [Rhipicephalus microplus]